MLLDVLPPQSEEMIHFEIRVAFSRRRARNDAKEVVVRLVDVGRAWEPNLFEIVDAIDCLSGVADTSTLPEEQAVCESL